RSGHAGVLHGGLARTLGAARHAVPGRRAAQLRDGRCRGRRLRAQALDGHRAGYPSEGQADARGTRRASQGRDRKVVADHQVCRHKGRLTARNFMNRLLGAMAAAMAIAAATFALPAAAQSYPSKPIRLVAPFPPGGSVDVVGRLLATKLSDSMGQQTVVDNRSGASGVIGTEVVMNAPPDGYTLLINTIPFVTNQILMPRAPYDPLRDFASISLVASSPSLVTVHPSLPVRSIQELVALAKSKPGQLYYSAAGVGTNPHIAGELFNLLADVNIVAVQYKGGG